MQKCKITKLLGSHQEWSAEFGYQLAYSGIHFKVDGEDYFLYSAAPDCDPVLRLYKGRSKGHLTCLTGAYGDSRDFIRFIRKPGCLKYVDTQHFLDCIGKYLEYTFENEEK